MSTSRFSYLKIILVFFLVVSVAPLFPHKAHADWQCFDWEWNWDTWEQDCYDWEYVDDTPQQPAQDPVPVAPTLVSNGPTAGTAVVCNGDGNSNCTTMSADQALGYLQGLLNAAYGEANFDSCDNYPYDCNYIPQPQVSYDSLGRLIAVTCGNGAVLTATYYDATSCTSPPNDCGQTNSGTGVNGSCSVSTPPNPSGYGDGCTSGANSCGQTNSGSIQCDGSCSASTPADPGNLGQACTSAPNSCGQTQANGTYQCDGSCSSTPPSDSGCNHPPNTPDLWGLYDAQTGTYYGLSAPAYNPHGYYLYANSVDPDGDNVALYFNWNAQGANWGAGPWVGSGQWSYDNRYVNADPGTYWVAVAAYDAHGTWSPYTAWQQVTLYAPAVGGSCSVSPSSGFVGTNFTFTTSGVSGGNGSFSYNWSGSEGLSGSGSSVSKTYNTSGSKSGSVTVSSGGASGTFSCNPTVNVTSCYGQGCTCPNNDCGTGDACSYPSIAQPSATASRCCSATPGVCPSLPSATLSADSLNVNVGQSTTLHWSCSNASSYSGNGPIGTGSVPGTTSVSTGVFNTAGAQPYQITCSGAGGTSPIANVTVTVHSPSASITANPARVSSAPGNTTTLTWAGTDVTSCTVAGPGVSVSGNANGSGSFTTQSPKAVTIAGQSTYTITCQGNGGVTVSKSVTVNVPPGFTEF